MFFSKNNMPACSMTIVLVRKFALPDATIHAEDISSATTPSCMFWTGKSGNSEMENRNGKIFSGGKLHDNQGVGAISAWRDKIFSLPLVDSRFHIRYTSSPSARVSLFWAAWAGFIVCGAAR